MMLPLQKRLADCLNSEMYMTYEACVTFDTTSLRENLTFSP